MLTLWSSTSIREAAEVSVWFSTWGIGGGMACDISTGAASSDVCFWDVLQMGTAPDRFSLHRRRMPL